MSEADDKLRNVFWLGGSPCAGKTTISEILSDSFDVDVYHVDEAFTAQAPHFDVVQQPALVKWCASSGDARWMRSAGDLLREVIACYQEHFELILRDVLALPGRKPLLVEGTALLPRRVAGLLPNSSHAMWVIPTADLQLEHYSKRVWARELVQGCSDPEAAFHNWMERDAGFAKWVEAEATALRLELLKVGQESSPDQNAEIVAAHFGFVD